MDKQRKTIAELIQALERVDEELAAEFRQERDPADAADASVNTTMKAVEQLVAYGAEAVEPLLAFSKRNSDGHGTHYAVLALSRIGDKRAVAPLLQMLNGGNDFLHLTAVRCLGRLKDERAVIPLIERLVNAETLVEQGRQKRESAYRKQYGFRARFGLWALRRLNADMIKTERINICSSAAQALGQLRDRRAIVPLQKCLNDPEEKIRAAAQNALARIEAA